MKLTMIFQMRGSAERVSECTSTMYDGMIAMMEPTESWVARWQRIGQWLLVFPANHITLSMSRGLVV